MLNLFNKDYKDKFQINLKGLVKFDEDIGKGQILITKEKFDGDYYMLLNTLLHYASLIYLMYEENPKRLDFNDWANKAYITTVQEEVI